jgi:hypothetical protein
VREEAERVRDSVGETRFSVRFPGRIHEVLLS